MDLTGLRADFPLLRREVNGNPIVYLDAASTTQKPQQVLDAMNDYYAMHNANVHRGAYTIAVEATNAYEGARAKVAGLINAASSREVVFSRGTTSAINTVAIGWGMHNLKPGDKILLTPLEHHSNIVPWQLVARFTGAELSYLPLSDDYQIDISTLDHYLDERVRLVAMSGMSNVVGSIGPVTDLAAAAHAVGALVLIDGAQMVPHMAVDVQELGADFLAFSSHKMLGPTGIGALWGRLDLLEAMEPAEGGGEMIRDVDLYESTWADVPHRFEAGTPPIAEAIGFGAAVDYLSEIGMDAVRKHEVDITGYALERLATVPDLTVYGPNELDARGGAVSFTLADIHPHDLATILDQDGICVRAGHHCAKPLMRILDVPATARASFYVYNERSEVDALIESLHKARSVFGVD